MTEDVTDNAEASRFEITEDGELAAYAFYRRFGNEINFLHTETDPRFRGRGLAGRLVRAALDEARKEGLAVVPRCPYVRGWIAEHPDYTELVPEDRRAQFGL